MWNPIYNNNNNNNSKFLQNYSYKIAQILSEDIAYYDLCKKLLKKVELKYTFSGERQWDFSFHNDRALARPYFMTLNANFLGLGVLLEKNSGLFYVN